MNAGELIRKNRITQKQTLKQLSSLTSLSVGYLSKLENSDRMPPFATLQTIATALGIEIESFFNSQDEQTEQVVRGDIFFSRSEDLNFEPVGDQGYTLVPLIHSYQNKFMSPFLMMVYPGSTSRFSHDAEEFLYVLSGKIELYYDGNYYLLNQGDSVYFDSRKQHRLVNPGTEYVHLLSTVFMYRRF